MGPNKDVIQFKTRCRHPLGCIRSLPAARTACSRKQLYTLDQHDRTNSVNEVIEFCKRLIFQNAEAPRQSWM